MLRALALVLLAAPAVAGCGGQSDEQKIGSAIRSYYKAFSSGDGTAACKHLSSEAIKQLEASSRRKCSVVLGRALKRPAYARIAPLLPKAKVLGVKISQGVASAKVQIPGAGANGGSVPTAVALKKEGGAWKIVSTAGGR